MATNKTQTILFLKKPCCVIERDIVHSQRHVTAIVLIDSDLSC